MSAQNYIVALFGGIGTPELVVILVVALLLFGPKNLPKMARSLGKSMEEFRRAAREVQDELTREPPPSEPPRDDEPLPLAAPSETPLIQASSPAAPPDEPPPPAVAGQPPEQDPPPGPAPETQPPPAAKEPSPAHGPSAT
ncbi:MAG: twin-arginine translocase TatA/TatE family subunit [Kiritimatiellaeota bacterium]|nr:twin-arginine translocase TatA/TatE family subunit [Kiritimatiellota bacterium]